MSKYIKGEEPNYNVIDLFIENYNFSDKNKWDMFNEFPKF